MALLESGKLILAVVVGRPKWRDVIGTWVYQPPAVGQIAEEDGVFIGDRVVYPAQKVVFLRGLAVALEQIAGAVAQIDGGVRIECNHRRHDRGGLAAHTV